MAEKSSGEKIQSIREAFAGGFRKPDASHMDVMIHALKQKEEALTYLHKRGLTDETIEHFQLGYDAEKNAISIPVFKRGELINIRYRMLDENAQTRYTQEKGCEVWLYNEEGIQLGITKGWVLIVEGEFDLMSAWQAGMKNVVSPASGKNSYGVWIELLDAVKKVYIAFDNDKPGKTASLDMAERIGVDKSFEVLYPDGIKDANEYFLRFTLEDFRENLWKMARPYYKYKFQGVGDIIDSMMGERDDLLECAMIPFVKFEEDWVAVISGDSNVGKTTYVLNVAEELTGKGIPTLVLPFERGIKSVGQRFLQVRFNKQKEDFNIFSPEQWQQMKEDAIDLPLYFSVPKDNELEDIISRAKRLFNVRVVIVDHLDYFVRGDQKVSKQADMMMKFKTMAQEHKVIFLVVHHIGKPKNKKRKRPTKEDLKGASDIYQIAEVVALLYQPDDGEIEVIIDKNKGKMGSQRFKSDMSTGKFSISHTVSSEDFAAAEKAADEEWENL